MTSRQHERTTPGSTVGEVTAQAQALVLLWERADDGVVPRIPPSQLRVLGVLARYGSMNLTRLTQELSSIPSSASRLCDRLEAAGLLVRRVSPDSGREVILTLSDEARRRLDAVAQIRRDDFAEVMARMSPRSRAALLNGLREFSEAARCGEQESARPA